MRKRSIALSASMALSVTLASCSQEQPPTATSAQGRVVRIGHFPNVTHTHALTAHHTSRAGASSGWFETRLGVAVEWFIYNAGPSAMEALIAGSIDLAYVGPSPAINAHLRAGGKDVRVIAGATRGGSALVVRKDRGLRTAADFRGKRIATPQLGNTQDVACRVWLLEHGLKVTQTGGDATVVPTQNPDQLALFQRGDIDAVWTVEPWVSRLETEAGGEVLIEEDDTITTVLVASARFLAERRDLARKFVAAHDELTQWLGDHQEEALQRVREELGQETGRQIDPALLARCWPRLRFSSQVDAAALQSFAEAAKRVGFLPGGTDLGQLVENVRTPGQAGQ